MNRKVLALTCAIGLSATMLTACGGQDNNAGNTRMNNVNGYGYTQQQRNNGMNNRMNDNDINDGVIPGGPTFGNGYGDRGLEETRGVGANGTGISGTSNGPRAANGTNGGVLGGNR